MKRKLSVVAALAVLLFSFQIKNSDEIRMLTLNEKEVKTTFKVDKKFYGLYKGRKSGYLKLNEDGTGSYLYDYQAFLPDNCEEGEIPFEWGFVIDEKGEVVKFERSYGYSYPIIYSCSGINSFQGCRVTSMVDYILVYKNGNITVSSSDDWKKQE